MNTASASFQEIREEIVNYLKTKSQFKDMNYAGSTIGALVDAMAYMYLNLMYYANFSIQECFLESAKLRSSVVSHCKALGYFPYQYTASRAKVRLKVDKDLYSSINQFSLVQPGIRFMGKDEEQEYPYVVEKVSSFYEKNGSWYCDLDLVQGRWLTDRFIQNAQESEKCVLLNPCDTSTLIVKVASGAEEEDFEAYVLAETIASFGKDEKLYYLQETAGNVEVYFGDGLMSRKWESGELAEITYLTTSGSLCNGIKSFGLVDNVCGLVPTNFSIEVLEVSNGGADRESRDSIKFNAPKYFQRQDRNVSVDDYTSDILAKFGGLIQSINVWGGEDNEPPAYGYVYAAILPKSGSKLSDASKKEITTALEKRNLPCISTKIVDPTFLYLDLNVDVSWYSNGSNYTEKELIAKVHEEAVRVFQGTFSGFRGYYQDSKLIRALLDVDNSIDDVRISKKISQNIEVMADKVQSYTLYFQNPIVPGSLVIGPWERTRNGIRDTYKLIDIDGLLWGVGADNVRSQTSMGTVNYTTGVVAIHNYDFNIARNQTLVVSCIPNTSTIETLRDYVLSLKYNDKIPAVTVKVNNMSSMLY